MGPSMFVLSQHRSKNVQFRTQEHVCSFFLKLFYVLQNKKNNKDKENIFDFQFFFSKKHKKHKNVIKVL